VKQSLLFCCVSVLGLLFSVCLITQVWILNRHSYQFFLQILCQHDVANNRALVICLISMEIVSK